MTKYYYNRPVWIDVTIQFHQLIKDLSKPNQKILEIGAGPTNKTTAFLASLGTVTGLDITPKVKGNQYCKDTIVYDGVHIPCKSNYFDLAVSDYVLEHAKYPLELCQEIHRILRAGGHFIFRTPNLWNYFSIAGKLTPHWIHIFVYKSLFKIRPSYEPYPTIYRMNTKKACRNILAKSGFKTVLMKVVESKPSDAMPSRLLFYPLRVWERMLMSNSLLESLRSNILCVASAIKKHSNK